MMSLMWDIQQNATNEQTTNHSTTQLPQQTGYQRGEWGEGEAGPTQGERRRLHLGWGAQ